MAASDDRGNRAREARSDPAARLRAGWPAGVLAFREYSDSGPDHLGRMTPSGFASSPWPLPDVGNDAVRRFIDGEYEVFSGGTLYSMKGDDEWWVGTSKWRALIATRAEGRRGDVRFRGSKVPGRARLTVAVDGARHVVRPRWFNAAAPEMDLHWDQPFREGLATGIGNAWNALSVLSYPIDLKPWPYLPSEHGGDRFARAQDWRWWLQSPTTLERTCPSDDCSREQTLGIAVGHDPTTCDRHISGPQREAKKGATRP